MSYAPFAVWRNASGSTFCASCHECGLQLTGFRRHIDAAETIWAHHVVVHRPLVLPPAVQS